MKGAGYPILALKLGRTDNLVKRSEPSENLQLIRQCRVTSCGTEGGSFIDGLFGPAHIRERRAR